MPGARRHTAAADAGAAGGAAAAPDNIGRALGLRLLAFAIAGFLAYPPVSLTPLIFVAFVPYIDAVALVDRAVRSRRDAKRARLAIYLGGSGFFFLMLHWLVFLPADEVTIPGLMIPATLVGALYLGLYAFLAQWTARRAARLGVPLWVGVPVAWVASEYMRTSSQLGCPWGLLGYGLTEMPVFLQGAEYFGIFGMSLVVGLINGLLFAAWRHPASRRRFLAAAIGTVVVLGAHGAWVMGRAAPAAALPVALIQGNIGRDVKFKPEHRVRNIRRMIELSQIALDPHTAPNDTLVVGDPGVEPALVIWPETAAPCRLRQDEGCQGMLRIFVDSNDTPIFTGFPDIEFIGEGEPQRWNASALIEPRAGITGSYSKVNLVPFGEAIPYQERFTVLQKIDFGEADFTRGAGFEPVAFGGGDFGVMICYESIFPAAGRIAARRGASFFVNITNDEWFGKSAGPYQHAAMARVRAIECRRGLVRCANTGVTFFVDRCGRAEYATPLYTERIVRGAVELGQGTTLYMRIGDVVPIVCLLVSIGCVTWQALRERRRAG